MSLQSDLDTGMYDEVITQVREWVAEDPTAAFADPTVKRWLGLRWKDMFLREAIQDPEALKAAEKPAGLSGTV